MLVTSSSGGFNTGSRPEGLTASGLQEQQSLITPDHHYQSSKKDTIGMLTPGGHMKTSQQRIPNFKPAHLQSSTPMQIAQPPVQPVGAHVAQFMQTQNMASAEQNSPGKIETSPDYRNMAQATID